MTSCMHREGSDFSWHGRLCDDKVAPYLVNEYCYRSKAMPLVTDIDIAIHGGFKDWPSEIWCERMRTVTKSYCAARGWFTD